MPYRVKVTAIGKKLYPELQAEYCADSNAGPLFLKLDASAHDALFGCRLRAA